MTLITGKRKCCKKSEKCYQVVEVNYRKVNQKSVKINRVNEIKRARWMVVIHYIFVHEVS